MIIIGFMAVVQIICVGLLTFAACREHLRAIRYRRQRDCLHKHFNIFAEKFFLYEPMPGELVQVLNEIEGK